MNKPKAITFFDAGKAEVGSTRKAGTGAALQKPSFTGAFYSRLPGASVEYPLGFKGFQLGLD